MLPPPVVNGHSLNLSLLVPFEGDRQTHTPFLASTLPMLGYQTSPSNWFPMITASRILVNEWLKPLLTSPQTKREKPLLLNGF